MDRIEAVLKFNCRVRGVSGGTPKAWPWVLHNGPAIVYISEDVTWDGNASILRFGDSSLHGVYHPYLRDSDHERETNRSTIVLCVMTTIIDEI